LRTNQHFTAIDEEIEEAWEADLARAMAMSAEATTAEDDELMNVLAMSAVAQGEKTDA